MKKLIFLKFAKDTSVFFLIMCMTVGLIVWTLQAVNYFDFVTQDGHGLKTYFSYIILNFPKIIHRIIPFIFFISLFYILTDYEIRNELLIFWTFGVSKINFANKIVLLSLVLATIQICIGGFFSPFTQYKGREYLKNSNIDFFTSLIKEGKFINAVKGLTIFIDRKNIDESYSNIFIDDSTKNNSKMIYAKDGILVDNDRQKIFKLFKGKVINNEESRINVFEFDQIDFNLKDFTSNTITVPKVQEISSITLLGCFFPLETKKFDAFNCEESLHKEIKQELLKRIYKPIYIPLITILCCFLIITSRNNVNYEKFRKIIFLFTFVILVFSETSLRYSTISTISMIIYLVVPWIIFIFAYFIFYNRVKNV